MNYFQYYGLYFLFLIFFNSGYSQSGKFINVTVKSSGVNFLGEVSFEKNKKDGFGIEYILGCGNLGSRMYDGKTKDLYGRTFKLIDVPYKLNSFGKQSFTYLNINHVGFYVGVTFNYSHEINRKLVFTSGISPKTYLYKESVQYDYAKYDLEQNKYVSVNSNFTKNHLGLSFSYEGVLNYAITKKMRIQLGLALPFYFMLTNKYYSESNINEPLMIGLEPLLVLGLKVKIN